MNKKQEMIILKKCLSVLYDTPKELVKMNYFIDFTNVIMQYIVEKGHRALYDKQYVELRYDNIPDEVQRMSKLRYEETIQYIEPMLFHINDDQDKNYIIDIGYGNGAFAEFLQKQFPSYSQIGVHDLTNYPVNENILNFTLSQLHEIKKQIWVITMFDVLEHMTEEEFTKNILPLQPEFFIITVPFCHYHQICREQGQEAAIDYFKHWKHRRYDEHLLHFDQEALLAFMANKGYNLSKLSHFEDKIRKPIDGRINTITAIFKKATE